MWSGAGERNLARRLAGVGRTENGLKRATENPKNLMNTKPFVHCCHYIVVLFGLLTFKYIVAQYLKMRRVSHCGRYEFLDYLFNIF